MFSKRLILLSMALFLNSCIGKVGEAPPPPEQQEFTGTQCLSDAMPVVQKFMKGEASERDLSASWDCVNLAVTKFQRYVRGKSSDRYTAQELTTFLEDNFFDQKTKKRVSPELQREMMKIKQLFVGGSVEFITQQELNKSAEIFSKLKTVSIGLNPYMKIFTLKWLTAKNSSNDIKFFEEGNLAIQNAAKEVSGLIGQNTQTYTLDDFTRLMAEFENFYQEEWTVVENVERFMPVVKKVKKAISGGDESRVSPAEWRSFMLLGARGYIQYLRYYYFIKSVPETNSGIRLSYIARSFEDGFSVFKDLVEEKPGGVVTKTEVAEILFTFSDAWPEFKTSQALVDQIMNLKQLAFGGTTAAWTTTDFETAKLKVNRLKFIFERFLPYYDVYGGSWEPEYLNPEDAEKFFAEAQFALEASAQELGSLLESDYNLQNIYALIKEIEDLYLKDTKKPDGKEIADGIRKALPLVIEFKNALYSQQGDVVEKNTWNSFLRFGARAFGAYLYYDYFMKKESVENLKGLAHSSVLVNQGLAILRDMIALKGQTSGFTKSEILGILMKVRDAGGIPADFDEQTLGTLLDAGLNHLLVDPSARLNNSVKPGVLGLWSVDLLAREFRIWEEAQRWGIRTFEQKPQWTVEELQTELRAALVKGLPTTSALIAVQELEISFGSYVPMTVNSKKFLNISNRYAWTYDWASYHKINLHRALTRALINSYAMDIKRIQNYEGFNLEEAERAFAQLRPVFVKLELLDESNVTFISSRFREANIFTPRSDGNNLVSLAEGVDLVSIIWSGVNVHAELIEDVKKKCLGGVKAPKLDTKVSVPCLRATYYASMPTAMTGVPDYGDYMKKSPRGSWNSYFLNVLKASGYVANKEEAMKYSDVSLVPQVIQYIEMVYARFDKNKDGFISTPDAMRAFPAFKGLMMELAEKELRSGDIKEKDLDDLFTYILRYGKPPETIGEKIRFLLQWKNKPEQWDVWADRTHLASILGFIADEVNKTKKAAAPEM